MILSVAAYSRLNRQQREILSDGLTAASWDALRAAPGSFQLPTTRAEWEREADRRPELKARAEAISRIANGAKTIASYGVGTGMLELLLSRLGFRMWCGDYSPMTVERLGALFPEATVEVHNLAGYLYPPADFHLFHRVDTELEDERWTDIASSLPRPGLLVVSETLTARSAAKSLALRVTRLGVRTGRVRSIDWWRMIARGDKTPLQVGDLTGFRI